jgi:transaldolase
LGQGILAIGLGVRYVSVLWCRMRDAGEDPADTVTRLAGIRDRIGSHTKIVVGSVREVQDVTDATRAGADVVTVPPRILLDWFAVDRSVGVVRQFHDDAAGIHL